MQQGHGTVTLPADYAREHVRLGYAATEHGYQSDTVDHAIALVSASTTRRGLYVAATRGRDENLLCVVTDSTDVAEARDVLEGILALDRADIPAVTQRRTLAHQVHGHEPAHAPRCAIPDWFEPLLAQARADLAAIQARDDEHAAERRTATSRPSSLPSGDCERSTPPPLPIVTPSPTPTASQPGARRPRRSAVSTRLGAASRPAPRPRRR